MRKRKLETLAAEAAERLRDGTRTDDAGVRSVAYHDVAAIMVEARQHFSDGDGPDWRGRSYPYRQWVGDVYGRGLVRRIVRGCLRPCGTTSGTCCGRRWTRKPWRGWG